MNTKISTIIGKKKNLFSHVKCLITSTKKISCLYLARIFVDHPVYY